MTTPIEPGEPRGEQYPTQQPYQFQPAPTEPAPARSGFASRLGKKTLVIGGVAGAVVVVAAVGLGVWAFSGSSQPVATAAAATTSAPSGQAPGAGGAGKERAGRGVIGTITAESGDTWTVTARSGKTMTVTISADTQFGTKKLPEQQSQFGVGDTIVVQGPVSDGSVTAVRVAERPTAPNSGTAPAGAPAPTTAGTPA